MNHDEHQHMDHDTPDNVHHCEHEKAAQTTNAHAHHDKGVMDHSGHDMADMDHSGHDHASMMEHGGHDMAHMDHSGHDMAHMDHSGHDHGAMMNHGGHMMHMGNMNRKLIVSLILTIPLIILTPLMGMQLPFTVTNLPGQNWLVLLIGTIVFVYGGTPFFNGARGELQSKQPAMMTLITMGITVAYVYSLYATIMNAMHPHAMIMNFFWELATLIDIMLIGHIIEMNAVMKAGSALDALAKLVPDIAHMQMETMIHDVPVSDLQADDKVLVKENERIPLDGTVLTGMPHIDESLLTGESQLVMKHVGDAVVGGALNGNSAFTMLVTKPAAQGFLSQVQMMVQQAQASKSRAENLADQVAGWLFYAALIAGILSFGIWTSLHGLAYSLPIAVTVFVIACPHALGLAIPLVVARQTGIGAQHGLLIQNRTALEAVGKIKYALMDKTGTLTNGDFKVQRVVGTSEISEDTVLTLMAALEAGSSHPLATGILAAVKDRELPVPVAQQIEAITGVGIVGTIDGTAYKIVNQHYLAQHQLTFDVDATGQTISYLVADAAVLGAVIQGDTIKRTAKAYIKELRSRGIQPVMLTGDNQSVAKHVADEIGINDVQANLRPEDKVALVQKYQQNGAVMFIGDGVNDAPALATADFGIAIGSGTDVAISVADVVLIKSNPADVITLLELAKQANRKMTENLWWGAGYNVLAIPLAAGVLIPFGFKLDPMVGAIVMSLSTIIVALNAMTLRLKK